MNAPAMIRREWAMPSPDTLSIRPIRQWALAMLRDCSSIVDPFARNCRIAHWRNDLSPETSAEYHMEAEEFLFWLGERQGVAADAIILDPPYSPRQIAECYQKIGKPITTEDTQNAALYRRVRDAAHNILRPGGIVLSFGWNSSGMGAARGYEMFDMLIVCHGGAHNDTICLAERKTLAPQMRLFLDAADGEDDDE
jgi:hypothetical protein